MKATFSKALLPLRIFGGVCMFMHALAIIDLLVRGLDMDVMYWLTTLLLVVIWYSLITFFWEINLESKTVTKRIGFLFLIKQLAIVTLIKSD